MSIWVLRGLRDGVVTTRWPRKPDEYADTWRGPATVVASGAAGPPASSSPRSAPLSDADISGIGCPTGAITATGGRVRVDQGKCILCGRCVAARPDLFAWSRGSTGPRAAALNRQALVVPDEPETDEALETARIALARRTAALRQSVHVRHVDAGSDGSEEWEIQALAGPVYDLHRLGVFFTASPRHADILLVTGAGTEGMAGPLATTYDGMPDPKVVIAVGTDACSGGLLGASPGSAPPDGVLPDSAGPGRRLTGPGAVIPVDVWVPGSPPSPFAILNALLMAVGKLAGDRAARNGTEAGA